MRSLTGSFDLEVDKGVLTSVIFFRVLRTLSCGPNAGESEFRRTTYASGLAADYFDLLPKTSYFPRFLTFLS